MANSRELAEQAFSLLKDALQESESQLAELDAELQKQKAPKDNTEERAQVLEHRLSSAESERDKWKSEAAHLAEVLENERAKLKGIRKKLDIAESGPNKIEKKEVNYWRSRAEQFDEETRQYKQRIAELSRQLSEVTAVADGSVDAGTEAAQPIEQSAVAEQTDQVDQPAQLEQVAEIEQPPQAEPQAEPLISAEELEALKAELESLKAESKRLEELEVELREEKECTINLSELANERREQITELSEKLDETHERYEEAKWRLERAGRFERLLIKRRSLISSLIDNLRSRQKSNTALKAGLDGLRRYKGRAEQQQQKLLLHIEELKKKLGETEDRLASQKSERQESLTEATESVTRLEEQLKAQSNVINELENELSTANAFRTTVESQSHEIEQLKNAIDSREKTIGKLQADIDQQTEQLGKLRGSESETMRLKVAQEQDQSQIVKLEEQIRTLESALAQQDEKAQAANSDTKSEADAELRKRDSEIARLNRSIKDQEKEIARLNEAVTGWQKKYEFLTAEPPSAYQSASGEK